MKVMVGICGGIAAYKAAELVRLLQQKGAQVDVAMTAAAERFITPLTLAALTGRTVYTSLWEPSGEHAEGGAAAFRIEHIAAGSDLDAIVIAPATANILAKLAHGIADDFLTTLCLATNAPLILAPAMNVRMWEHPATQANLNVLIGRGARLVAPDEGYLACGMTGSGRLGETEAIAAEVLLACEQRSDLFGETILITAGGTREPIDPVRFLGNRSSGKMGHALAEEASARGASVILVTASSLAAPAGCLLIRVSTAGEMAEAVRSRLAEASIVIGAAAVGDYRMREAAPQKIRRDGPLVLSLEPTEDIVAEAAARRGPGTLVIGFAAETEDLETNGRAKLLKKGADAVVANLISDDRTGFESDRNAGLFLTAERTVALPESSKSVMARRILDEILALRRTKGRNGVPTFAGAGNAVD